MTLAQTLRLLDADIRHRQKLFGRPTRGSYLRSMLCPHQIAVGIFRLQHWLDQCGCPRLARCLGGLNVILFKVDIGSKAEIGEGLVLGHANMIVISDCARLGRGCILTHHNTILARPVAAPGPVRAEHRSASNTETALVQLGDHVLLGAGARVTGALKIGAGVVVGMNAVVTGDCEPDTFVVGVPARVLRRGGLGRLYV